MIKQASRVLFLTFAFALFDALIGGGVAAAIQKAGAWNQTVNDFYQLGFSIAMAAVLLICFFVFGWRAEILAVLVLLLGYVEDTLYYVFMPWINPLIKLISHGAEYHVRGGGLFPPEISGWLGWLGRATEAGPISLGMPAILAINIFAIAVAAGILLYSSVFSSRLKS